MSGKRLQDARSLSFLRCIFSADFRGKERLLAVYTNYIGTPFFNLFVVAATYGPKKTLSRPGVDPGPSSSSDF